MKVENAKTKRNKGFSCMLENEIKVLIELKYNKCSYFFFYLFSKEIKLDFLLLNFMDKRGDIFII